MTYEDSNSPVSNSGDVDPVSNSGDVETRNSEDAGDAGDEYIQSLVYKYAPSGTRIQNMALYRSALRHRSPKSERLEYLGDAVVYLAVASYVHARYPKQDEGFMTRLRTRIVRGSTLGTLCLRATNLASFVDVKFGAGASASTGSSSQVQILEDIFEAFLGAMYEDLGFDVARTWLVGFLEDNLDFAQVVIQQEDDKDAFMRLYSRVHGSIPRFEVITLNTGCVFVRIFNKDNHIIATGKGADRKQAERAAARHALQGVSAAVGAAPTPPLPPYLPRQPHHFIPPHCSKTSTSSFMQSSNRPQIHHSHNPRNPQSCGGGGSADRAHGSHGSHGTRRIGGTRGTRGSNKKEIAALMATTIVTAGPVHA